MKGGPALGALAAGRTVQDTLRLQVSASEKQRAHGIYATAVDLVTLAESLL